MAGFGTVGDGVRQVLEDGQHVQAVEVHIVLGVAVLEFR